MVLIVSTGVSKIRNNAAIVEALRVFIEMLKSFVRELWLRNSRVSLFENVSPNQDIGP